MAGFAWAGVRSRARCCSSCSGDHWQLGAVAVVLSQHPAAAARWSSYYAILVDISTEDERDRVSSRGWAFGYLGGGLLLALNLVRRARSTAPSGLDKELAVRLSLLSAALWWAGFTLIPFLRLRDHAARARGRGPRAACWPRSFGQLFATLREHAQLPDDADLPGGLPLLQRRHPDRRSPSRRSTAPRSSSFGQSVLIATILLIQFVAFGGALLFGRLGAAATAPTGRILVRHLRLDGDRGRRDVPARRQRRAVPARRRRDRRSSWAAPRRCPARSSACSSPAAARASTSRSTTPASAARRGSARCCSAWSSSVTAPTGRRSSRWSSSSSSARVFLLRLDPERGIREAGNQVPPRSEALGRRRVDAGNVWPLGTVEH